MCRQKADGGFALGSLLGRAHELAERLDIWMGNGGPARYGWGTGDRTAARRRSAQGAGWRVGVALAALLTTGLKPAGGANDSPSARMSTRTEGPLAQSGRKDETASRKRNEPKGN